MTRPSRSDVVAIGLIALAIVAVYCVAGPRKFINLDDLNFVFENPHVRNGLTLDGFRWAFTNLRTEYWIPVTWLSFMANAHFLGGGVEGYYAVNVVLHLFNAILLYLLLRSLTGSVVHSMAVALLFAVHPTHVQAVVWAAARKDLLSTLFGLVSLLSYVRWVGDGSRPAFFLSVIALALGLMSKPMLVVVPAFMLLLDMWPLGRWAGTGWKTLVAEKGPHIALSAAAVAVIGLSMMYRGNLVPATVLPWSVRAVLPVTSAFFYLEKTFLPSGLAVIYPFLHGVGSGMRLVGQFVVVGGAAAGAWFLRDRLPHVAVGVIWFLVGIFPVSGVFASGNEVVTDRFAYLPHIGLFVAVVWGTCAWVGAVRWRQALSLVVLLVAVVGFAAVARSQVVLWREPADLFNRAVEVTEGNWLARYFLANSLLDRGDLPEAIESASLVKTANPRESRAYLLTGQALLRLGRGAEALVELETALKLNPSDPVIHTNLAVAKFGEGDAAGAEHLLRMSIELDPESAAPRMNMGVIAWSMGDVEEAARWYADAVATDPWHPVSRRNLANALRTLGRLPEAAAHFDAAFRLEPGNVLVTVDSARVLSELGRRDEAVRRLEEGLKAVPDSTEIREELARVEPAMKELR